MESTPGCEVEGYWDVTKLNKNWFGLNCSSLTSVANKPDVTKILFEQVCFLLCNIVHKKIAGTAGLHWPRIDDKHFQINIWQ